MIDTQTLTVVILALAAGGILKGAAGAGAPVIAVPVMAMFFDVRFAVVIFAYPNLLGNIYQAWAYRAHLGPKRLWLAFAVGGFLGVPFGTFLLFWLPPDALRLALAAFIVFYIGFRLARPDWSLARVLGERIAGVVGAVGGVFYGAIALSAPISVTFVSAMRLRREEFIAIMSMFFLTMGLAQMPSLYLAGALTPQTHILGAVATVSMIAAMRPGNWFARYLSPTSFDRLILILLALIELRILTQAL